MEARPDLLQAFEVDDFISALILNVEDVRGLIHFGRDLCQDYVEPQSSEPAGNVVKKAGSVVRVDLNYGSPVRRGIIDLHLQWEAGPGRCWKEPLRGPPTAISSSTSAAPLITAEVISTKPVPAFRVIQRSFRNVVDVKGTHRDARYAVTPGPQDVDPVHRKTSCDSEERVGAFLHE